MVKEFLLKLARKTLENIIIKKELPEIKEIPKKAKNKKATFVTLEKNGQLRGCIGNILPEDPLYKSVIKNIINAAFNDPRFPQVQKDELKHIKIKISILTEPKKLQYKDSKDLLNKIKKNKHGIIINKGIHSATFLPSVWDIIKNKKEFLSQLCLKAGLSNKAWENEKLHIKIYEAEYLEE